MTATEKYLQMNHNFILLRDSIFNPDVDEEPENEKVEQQVLAALGILDQYLTYYKELNQIKTRQKE
ncbi:MAG: hypothetical protein J5527_00595 [Treponema sp.]|jgi:hypothetical protein|nr:hypothetical protein [Treponema sp.]